MLDIELIRQNPKKIKKGAKAKGYDCDRTIDQILELDKKRREVLQKAENLRAEKNKISKDLKEKPDQKIIEKSKKIKDELGKLEEELKKIEPELSELELQIPNMPASDVKVGKDDSENFAIEKIGTPPKFDFKIRDHIELGKDLDLIDIERAAKVSGSRFCYLKNEAIILEFAIVNWVLDILTKKGFSPIVPPVLINEENMRAMGYVEREEAEEIYYLDKGKQYLVGTAEQAIGPMHKDEVFSEDELPKRYVGFSSCFRREAGSYGKDVKGIIRVHQFDKLEMFSFCKPADSNKENFYFLDIEKELVRSLGLPFQVVHIVTADLGFPAARKLDIETWVPSQGRYRETHSTSTTTDFQARRLNIRYRDKKTGKTEFVHTVNGTAIAIGRILVAILENYQQKGGFVKVPEVLQKYCGFKEIKKR